MPRLKTKSSICANGLPIDDLNKEEIPALRLTYTSSGQKHKALRQFILSSDEEDDADFQTGLSLEAASIKRLLKLAENPDDTPCEEMYNIFLAQLLNVISLSPMGSALIKEAAGQNWSLSFTGLSDSGFSVDIEARRIDLDHHGLKPEGLIRSAYFSNTALVNLVRALRDVWHEKRHGSFDTLFSPDAILMLERVRAADCDVLAIAVAWELRAAGYVDIWRHVMGSEIGDIAMAYSDFIERNPAADYITAKALKRAFMQWYEQPERINECDHAALEYMDDVLENSDLKNPFGQKIPTRIGIEVLSCLPDRTAYLQGFGGEILADPKYSGLSEPVNQSHLMHILYDLEATVINNVPFRDASLAARIFPQCNLFDNEMDSDILADI